MHIPHPFGLVVSQIKSLSCAVGGGGRKCGVAVPSWAAYLSRKDSSEQVCPRPGT